MRDVQERTERLEEEKKSKRSDNQPPRSSFGIPSSQFPNGESSRRVIDLSHHKRSEEDEEDHDDNSRAFSNQPSKNASEERITTPAKAFSEVSSENPQVSTTQLKPEVAEYESKITQFMQSCDLLKLSETLFKIRDLKLDLSLIHISQGIVR